MHPAGKFADDIKESAYGNLSILFDDIKLARILSLDEIFS